MLLSIVTTVVLVSLRLSSVQADCNPSPPSTLISGENKDANNVPVVLATSNTLQPVVGGQSVDAWTMFSVTQVQQNGLWCQVNESNNAGLGNNIGDWFYPTASGFTLVPNDGSTPYLSLKCTNQIGLVVDGDVTNNQGIVKCTTTIPNLDTDSNYWAVYSDNVFNSYSGPIVQDPMTLSILSDRDADSDLLFQFTFVVSSGPPSFVQCTNGVTQIFSARGIHPNISRDVMTSQYVNNLQPDKTLVKVILPPQPKKAATYTCTVTVEGRENITTTNYSIVSRGTSSSIVTVTVAGTPTGVTITRVGLTSITVSWIAPSPVPDGYEVFYEQNNTGDPKRFSGGTTSNTEWTLNGLTLGQTYSIFVVAYGQGAVLPSVHSNSDMMTLPVPQLPVPTLVPASSSIMVSWILPQYTPDSYSITYSCQLLCGSQEMTQTQLVSNGTTTTLDISSLTPGSSCIVSVTAVFDTTNNSTATSTANTRSEAPAGAPGGLTSTSVESRSLSLMWGTVPCSDQNGPITGYNLRYSNGTSITDTTGEGTRQYVLTGLTPYTRYSIQVAAVNDGGTGSYSELLSMMTLQDVPGPVSSLSADPEVVQITLSWNPPTEQNGQIIVYEIIYNGTGGDNMTYTNTTATRYTLEGFSPNTVVSFQVRAYTKIGPGRNVSSQVSTGSVPQVTDVKAIPFNDSAVVVSWTPVNLTVDHYCTIYTTTTTGAKRGQSHSDIVTVRSCAASIVSGLRTGQYQFSVSVTVIGNGQSYTGQVSNPSDPITVDNHSSPVNMVALGVGVGVLFLVVVTGVIIVGAVVYSKRKNKQNAYGMQVHEGSSLKDKSPIAKYNT